MRAMIIGALYVGLIIAGPTTAQAKGCIKGAVVGGVAGHYAGHHALVGAAAGCLAGRHLAKQKSTASPHPPTEQPGTK